jgi:hypothetical protein
MRLRNVTLTGLFLLGVYVAWWWPITFKRMIEGPQ